jgi:predicted ATPase
MSPADLGRAPAVRLFVERVRDVQPDFRLTPVNGPTVTAICRRLDALPLALELAAPWIKVLTVEDLLRRLTHDALLSTVGRRDLPQRQQTMNATVAWSYQLLGPEEQRAFRRFGALPGRFSIDAAAVVLAGRGEPRRAGLGDGSVEPGPAARRLLGNVFHSQVIHVYRQVITMLFNRSDREDNHCSVLGCLLDFRPLQQPI